MLCCHPEVPPLAVYKNPKFGQVVKVENDEKLAYK
jgi:hypothetical protein